MRTLVLALAIAVFASVPSASAQSVAGEWNASMNTPGGTREFKIIFVVKGDSLSGTVKRASGDVPLRGTINGNAVTFSYSIVYGDNPLLLTVTATLAGDAMKGTIDLGGGATEAWSAKRAAAPAPPAGARLRSAPLTRDRSGVDSVRRHFAIHASAAGNRLRHASSKCSASVSSTTE